MLFPVFFVQLRFQPRHFQLRSEHMNRQSADCKQCNRDPDDKKDFV